MEGPYAARVSRATFEPYRTPDLLLGLQARCREDGLLDLKRMEVMIVVNSIAAKCSAAVERLVHLVEQDEVLRGHLEVLADCFLELLTRPTPPSSVENEPVSVQERSEPAPPALTVQEQGVVSACTVPEIEPTLEDDFACENSEEQVQSETKAGDRLSATEKRLRLKAECIRWLIQNRPILNGRDISAEADFFSRAGAIGDCSLWMLKNDWQRPAEARLLKHLAGWYDTLAGSVALTKSVLAERTFKRFLEDALWLLAEAQSGLRVAVQAVHSRNDPDQLDVFWWLRSLTAERRIYIGRFMTSDDAAQPTSWTDVQSQIDDLQTSLQRTKTQKQEQQRLLGKLKYVVARLGVGDEHAERHRETIKRTIEDLLSTGLPPSDREMRSVLLPVLTDVEQWRDASDGIRMVAREIANAKSQVGVIAEAPPSQVVSDHIDEVRQLLGGTVVVLIGGDPRKDAHDRIVKAFNLHDLDWISTTGTESVTEFRAPIVRPNVSVVLLAIRWARHSFGDIRRYCEAASKPLVRLPTGLNPSLIAHHVLEQVGPQLRRSASAPS